MSSSTDHLSTEKLPAKTASAVKGRSPKHVSFESLFYRWNQPKEPTCRERMVALLQQEGTLRLRRICERLGYDDSTVLAAIKGSPSIFETYKLGKARMIRLRGNA